MKSTLAIFLLIFISFPDISLANDWDLFENHLSSYYFFDDQNFSEFSCNIVSSETKLLVSNVIRDINHQNLGLTVEENIDNFKINHKRNGQSVFNKPKFQILKPRSYFHPNLTEIDSWISNTENLYNNVVQSTFEATESIFRWLEKPNKNSIKLVLIDKKPNEISIIYEEDANLTSKNCTRNQCILESDSGPFKYIMTISYEDTKLGKIPEKLKLEGYRSGEKVADGNSTIIYQKIGDILIPKKFITENKFSDGKSAFQTGGEIEFKNCTIR